MNEFLKENKKERNIQHVCIWLHMPKKKKSIIEGYNLWVLSGACKKIIKGYLV